MANEKGLDYPVLNYANRGYYTINNVNDMNFYSRMLTQR